MNEPDSVMTGIGTNGKISFVKRSIIPGVTEAKGNERMCEFQDSPFPKRHHDR